MEENNKQPIPVPPTPLPPKAKIVETYAEDMAEVIKSDHGDLVKKIIHEEEEREIEKQNISPEATRNKIFAAVGSILLLCSVALVGFFFIIHKADTVPVQTPFTSMIFNDATGFIEVADLDKDQIIQSIRTEIGTKDLKVNGLEGIYLTLNNNTVGLRKFNELIKGNFAIVNNDFVDDNFLIGFMNGYIPGSTDTSRDAFILLQMRSFTDIFPDMRIWEDKMFNDLHGLFDIGLAPETAYLLTKDFDNGIVQNKNARILHRVDSKGNNRIVLMYVFVDDTHVVITRSEEVVREIITRLLGNNLRN